MENNLTSAIEQIKKKEETGLNYIYSKTYNYVYLRAKNILVKENEIQNLMQDVYLKMMKFPEEISGATMYEWLGKQVYLLGCAKYRKKKAREASFLEIEKGEIETRKNTDADKAAAVITERLEELPDLYQATFYAFYYDYMPVKDIADVMDVTEGVVINRLNYTRKYMIKALEEYQEENNVKVFFSVEAVRVALRQWSVGHCLGITTAQFVYSEICKKAGLKSTPVYLEGKEFAGVNNTVVYHRADDTSALLEQFETYELKTGADRKKLGIVAGAIALVIAILVGIALFVTADKDEGKGKQPENNIEQNQDDTDKDESNKDDTNQDDSNVDETNKGDDSNNQAADSEYILPESNTRELTRDEIKHLSKEQLRLARNEIFARHGMIFGVEDLDQYFKEKSWYNPTVSSDEFYSKVNMSLVEEANINLIVAVEEEK